MPGTSSALPHVPAASSTTNAWWPELSLYVPAAAQLPADAHESEVTEASPPTLSEAVPGTFLALPQVPAVSSTTNAWVRPELSSYDPPAAQLPADHAGERADVAEVRRGEQGPRGAPGTVTLPRPWMPRAPPTTRPRPARRSSYQ